MKNPVVHFEIAASDTNRAHQFYEKVFDWKFSKIPMMNYTAIQTTETDENQISKKPGNINGGIMEKGEKIKDSNIVVSTQNISETLEKVKKAGGKVIMDVTTIPIIGLYARFVDTEGNEVGVIQSDRLA